MAIIAVLASLIFPIAGRIKQTEQVTQSSSNLKCIGNAILLYANDNEQHLPVWHDYTIGQYWWEQLLPYVDNNTAIYHSPGHHEFDATSRDKLAETISYGWNYNVAGRHRGDSSMKGDHAFSLMSFPEPQRTLMVAEGSQSQSWGFIEAAKPDGNRYGGRIPSVFLDGHVDVLPVTDLQQIDPWFVPITPVPW